MITLKLPLEWNMYLAPLLLLLLTPLSDNNVEWNGISHVAWQDRVHFFAVCARAMRRIRVDAARHRLRAKRGGGRKRVPLDQADPGFADDPVEMLALDEALDGLERIDPVVSEIVHLRFFAGLKVAEVARALDIAERTVEAKWAFGRAWLHSRLEAGVPG